MFAEHHVIIVCTGNICRSPLAEALLAADLGEIDPTVAVSSAGTSTRPGSSPDRHLRRVAQKLGVNVSGHLSQDATMQLLDSADLVLAMTAAHADEVAWRSPDTPVTTLLAAARRATMLSGSPTDFDTWVQRLTAEVDGVSAYVAGVDDVADPYGGPRRGYQRMSEVVDHAVRQLVRHWCGR